MKTLLNEVKMSETKTKELKGSSEHIMAGAVSGVFL